MTQIHQPSEVYTHLFLFCFSYHLSFRADFVHVPRFLLFVGVPFIIDRLLGCGNPHSCANLYWCVNQRKLVHTSITFRCCVVLVRSLMTFLPPRTEAGVFPRIGEARVASRITSYWDAWHRWVFMWCETKSSVFYYPDEVFVFWWYKFESSCRYCFFENRLLFDPFPSGRFLLLG